MADLAASKRQQLADWAAAQAEQRNNPATTPAIRGSAVGTERMSEEIARASQLRRERIARLFGADAPGQAASKPRPNGPGNTPGTAAVPLTATPAVIQLPAPTPAGPDQTAAGPTGAATTPAPVPVPHAKRVMHGARIVDRPPASLERDPQPPPASATTTIAAPAGVGVDPGRPGDTPPAAPAPREIAASTPRQEREQRRAGTSTTPAPAPAQEDASVLDRSTRAIDTRDTGARATALTLTATAAPNPVATSQAAPPATAAAPVGEPDTRPPEQTPEEIEAEAERKRRRKAILAARRRNRGLGL